MNDTSALWPKDFFETFGLGSDDKYIGGSDASGVALAAIQGLYELIKELQTENAQMRLVMAQAGLQ